MPPPAFAEPKVSAGLVAFVKVVPLATTMEPPLTVMAPLLAYVAVPPVAPSVKVPASFLVSVPVVPVSPPVIVVFPVPPIVRLCVLREIDASVVRDVTPVTRKLLNVLMTPFPLSVVVPKVMPAVPLETLAPAVFVSVKAPRLSVPNVAVVPAPAAALSDQIAALPPTVVAPKP